MKFFILIVFIFSLTLFAYQDYDIDGVEDDKDRCPNTPFDKLVDQWGCPKDDKYNGSLTFKIGSDISIDKEYKQINNLNFYLNYRYNQLDLSISNANYTVLDSPIDSFSDTGDIYVSGGYLFTNDSLYTKISLGSKISTSKVNEETDNYIRTGENDYFAAVNINYFLNDKQNLFLYYGYTISGDSDKINYENTNTYSIGSGYALNSQWYSALSYEYSSSVYTNVSAYSALSWFNSYDFSDMFFGTINYAYALDNLSYDHTISIKLGIYFE